MSTQTPIGFNWADAMEPLEARRRARAAAAFVVRADPDRALEAMASLAEWCDGDPELMAHTRAELRDTRRRQAAVAENNRDAVELLELIARA